MLRARRPMRGIASVAAVAMLGLTMAGCRPDPAVAAYVGGTQFTDASVVRIVDELVAALPAEQRDRLDPKDLKNQVLHFLVLDEVVTDYADREDIDVPPADPEGIARQQGFPPNLELTRVLAEYSAAMGALSGAAKSISPTEPDQREAFEHAVENQADAPSFEEVQQSFNEETMGNALGMRALLTEALADADVTVNPRYDGTYRLPLQIGQARSWLDVELEGASPVRDAPTTNPAREPAGQE